jgi:ParB family transcriptional regulator, chromosome partitioning protein
MTASNAAEKSATEKVREKLAEKRRALGRGLESLLPGPRVVPASPTLPQSARQDGAPASSSSSSPEFSSGADGGRAGSPVPTLSVPGTLDQLQAAAAGHASYGEHAFELALDRIQQNPYQTRTEFDPNALAQLAASIQAQGVLQPIMVRPRPVWPGKLQAGPEGQRMIVPAAPLPEEMVPEGEQRFVLILGERRYRASKMAGKTTIPAIVKRVSEQQAAEMTLVENLQRQDLECLDQAQAFSKLSTDFNLTQEDIGKRVGVSREQVSNYLRLLKLPPEVQGALRKKELTYSHARLLLALDDDTQITKVARVAIAKKMSVALLQELVMDSHIPKDPPESKKVGGARWVDPNVRAEQRSLEAVLGLRVRIRDRKGKGKILIEYGTIEEFGRLIRMLRGK